MNVVPNVEKIQYKRDGNWTDVPSGADCFRGKIKSNPVQVNLADNK